MRESLRSNMRRKRHRYRMGGKEYMESDSKKVYTRREEH